ncbi:hypothetical protein PRUPE_7G080600 [Prunus persica]|uniref:Uncharacterized protein n=1 Tax=Prunus persica TaxID=3760 RepID=M5W759_PRUPE|nr:hypothetical protein PRUPE_7G080600 [Prunus persica]
MRFQVRHIFLDNLIPKSSLWWRNSADALSHCKMYTLHFNFLRTKNNNFHFVVERKYSCSEHSFKVYRFFCMCP